LLPFVPVPRLVAALVAVLFCSGASAAPGRRTVAVLAPAGGGLDADTARLVEELVVGSLDATGRFRVTSRSDMASVLGFEKQKQTLGCDESASCIAEIAGALGVELLAAPRAGKLENLTVLTLSIIDARSASAVARARRTMGSLTELPGAIDAMVAEMLPAVTGGATAPSPTLPQKNLGEGDRAGGASSARSLPRALSGEGWGGGRRFGAKTWIAAGVALAAAGAATYFALSARSEATARDTTLRAAQYDRAQAAADAAVVRTNIAWGVAGATGVAAGLLFAFQF